MSSSFRMSASKLESIVHAFLHGLFAGHQECERLHKFYCSCLVGYSWILLYSDWLFRNVPTISLICSTVLFILHHIFSIINLFLVLLAHFVRHFMGFVLVDYFRLRTRKNYKRLKRFVLLPKKIIMGTIWGGYANKETMSDNNNLNMVEVVPTHVSTQRSLGANVFDEPYENPVDTQCRCCPTARSGHRSLCDLDYVYVVGGYNARVDGNRTMREVWRLNTVTNAWSQVEVDGTFPESMASFVACQRDYDMSHSLIFGGTGFPFGLSATNKLYSLKKDASERRFRIDEEPTIGDPPPPSYGSAFVSSDNKTFYLIGGTTGHEYNLDIWKLSWSQKENVWEWTQLTRFRYDSPIGRYRHEAVLFKNLIIIFGGGTPQWSEQMGKLTAFNVEEREFLEIETNPDPKNGFPVSRKCHAVVQYDADVYIIGGCNEPSDEEFIGAHYYNVLNDIWKIHLPSLTWTKLDTTLTSGVFFHSAVVNFEGCIYIFGGCCDGRSAVRTNRVQRLWIRPPSFQRLAIQTILQYLPELVSQFPDRIRISNVSGIIRDFHNHLNSNAA